MQLFILKKNDVAMTKKRLNQLSLKIIGYFAGFGFSSTRLIARPPGS